MLKSAFALTYEMDDVEAAAEQLAASIKKDLTLSKNSCGFLFCDSEMEHEAFIASLEKKLQFEIVGFSTVATLDRTGFHDMAATLTVLTSDDVEFAVALSDSLDAENVHEQIKKTYAEGVEKLGGQPKLIFAVPSYNLEITLDDYPETLDEVSGGVPVFGGLPASNPPYGANLIFAKGKTCTDRMALLLMAGNIRPVFSVQNTLSNVTEMKRPVTHSSGNVIYSVGNGTFVDFLRSFGLPVEKIATEDNTTFFVSNPLMVEIKQNENDDGIPIVRTLHSIDLEKGSGTAIGKVPQAASISLGAMRRSDIEEASEIAMRDLAAKMEKNGKDGYVYSAVLCVSCIGRYMVLAPDRDVEGKVLASSMPEGVTFNGFYGYGEICPTSMRGDRAVNRAHNESIVLCAL